MVRFILVRNTLDRFSEAKRSDYETLEVECPQLEQILTRGGLDQSSYDFTELKGAEIVRAVSSDKETR